MTEETERVPSRLRRLLWISVAILAPVFFAVLIYSAFYLGRNRYFFSNVAEEAIDRRMDIFADTERIPAGGSQYIMLDFDDQTLAAAGDPTIIPVTDVARTLDRLAVYRPAMVFVDIDETAVPPGPELDLLKQALLHLASSQSAVFLDREILGSPRGPVEPHFRATPLADLLQSTPSLSWFSTVSTPNMHGAEYTIPPVSPLIAAPEQGAFVRLPSAALAALLVRDAKSAEGAKRLFEEAFQPLHSCGGRPGANAGITFCTTPPIILGDPDQPKVRYSMRWKSKAFEAQVIPVRTFLAQAVSSAPETLARFRNAVVMVGSSSSSSRDIHPTPLGPMPGSFILLNMIRSWLEHGPEGKPPFWDGLSLVIFVSFASASVAVAALLLTPERLVPWTKKLLPPVLTGILAIIFYALNNTAISIGLIVMQYVVVLIAESTHHILKRATRLAPEGR